MRHDPRPELLQGGRRARAGQADVRRRVRLMQPREIRATIVSIGGERRMVRRRWGEKWRRLRVRERRLHSRGCRQSVARPRVTEPVPASILLRHEGLGPAAGNTERRGLILRQWLSARGESSIGLLQVAPIGPRFDLPQGAIPVRRQQCPALTKCLKAKAERRVSNGELLRLQHEPVQVSPRHVRRSAIRPQEERFVQGSQALHLALQIVEARSDGFGGEERCGRRRLSKRSHTKSSHDPVLRYSAAAPSSLRTSPSVTLWM